uniref:Uncharacterized protein n=1 Tax=Oryza brachyantha TaxID=4533 RepID=J3LXM8_ORYBR
MILSLTLTCLPRSASTSSTGHWTSCFPSGDSQSFLGMASTDLNAGPALVAVVGDSVGLVGPAPDDPATLGWVVERLGGVEVAVVVAEAVVVVGEFGV